MLIGLILVATNYKQISSDLLHLIMILLESIAIVIHGDGSHYALNNARGNVMPLCSATRLSLNGLWPYRTT